MSTPFDDMLKSPSETGAAPPKFVRTRPFYWSLRREVFEHRGVWMAPLAGAALALFGFLISSWKIPGRVRDAVADPAKLDNLMIPYSFVAMGVLVLSFAFAIFYSIDALHGERRDRSILFWKSLPVSDATTVLSKAAIPLAVLPAIMIAVIFAGQVVALAWSSLVVLFAGLDPWDLWSRLNFGFMWFMIVYGLVFLALWYAPVVGYLLMVSAWAKRMPILWAIAPFIAIGIIERMAFGTARFFSIPEYRLGGGFALAFTKNGSHEDTLDGFADLDLSRTFANPDLWLGLIAAALFVFVAIRLRRSRSPL